MTWVSVCTYVCEKGRARISEHDMSCFVDRSKPPNAHLALVRRFAPTPTGNAGVGAWSSTPHAHITYVR